MKFAVYTALISVAAAQQTWSFTNPNPKAMIDGATFEEFQEDMMEASHHAAEFVDSEVAPDVKKWAKKKAFKDLAK